MENILLSLIVPIYNGSPYISHFFHQFDGQNMEHVEIVCIDDGSKDDSYEKLRYHTENVDFRVSLYRQNNAGVSAARNAGISRAQGKYVAFLDVDDGITHDYIETLKQYAQKDTDVLVFSSKRVHEGYHRENHPIISDTILTKEQMLNRFWSDPTKLGVVNLLVKLSYLKNCAIACPVGYKYYEDYDMLLQIFAQTDRIEYLDKVMYFYILREGSAMGRFNADRINCLKLMYQRGKWLETTAPEFAPVFQKWGTSRLYWSVLWQAALAFPEYADFAAFAKTTHARKYLVKLRGYPDGLLQLSSIVFLIWKSAYYLAVRTVGRRKSKVLPTNWKEIQANLDEDIAFY